MSIASFPRPLTTSCKRQNSNQKLSNRNQRPRRKILLSQNLLLPPIQRATRRLALVVDAVAADVLNDRHGRPCP